MILSILRMKHLLALLVICGSMLSLALAGTARPAAAQQELQITLLGSHPLPGAGHDMVVVGNRAYVTYWTVRNRELVSGLHIFDVRDPGSPVLLGEYSLEPRLPYKLVVTDAAAIISFSTRGSEPLENQSGNGLLFISTQDATAPQLLSIYPTAAIGNLALVGNQLYVAENPFNPDGPEWGQLHIFDVRDPSAPTLMGTYDAPDDQIAGLVAQGDLVYLGGTNTGIQVLDVSDPSNPSRIGGYFTPYPVDPALEGDRLYFASEPGGLSIIDISDPTNLRRLGIFIFTGGIGVRVQDGIASIVRSTSWTTQSVDIIDARNPQNPVRLAQYGEDITLAVPVGDLIYLLTNDQLQIVRMTGIPAPPPSPTARCFPETGSCIDGRIRDYWEANGGLPVFGYPISEQRAETIEGTTVQAQWFERNRLELHPEHDPPYDVLLGRLGVDVLEQQGRDWQAFPRSEPQESCRYFAETQQNVCGDVLAAWRASGLDLGDPGISEAESLALFGLPISPLHEEAINGQPYQVQWFERARFELHPENDPPYDVLLGLLGREMTSEPAGVPTPDPTPEPSLACQGRLAFQMDHDDNLDIYTINADGTDLQRLTDDPASDKFPVWSPNGTRIAFVSRRTGIEKIYVMDADGSHQTRLTDDPDGEGDIAWSPDGKTIAFTGVQRTLWTMHADGSQKRQLAPSLTYSLDSTWSPDGTQIAFWAITEGTAAIYLINADGTGLHSLGAGESPAWSPDGTHLAFERDTSFNNSDIFLLDMETGQEDQLTTDPANEGSVAWSPDGTRISYSSAQVGNGELFTMAPDGTARTQLTQSQTDPPLSNASHLRTLWCIESDSI